MKFFLQKASDIKGFTLIELLVVIGILGILVSALAAILDPFEQMRKADDLKSQDLAIALHDSLARYEAAFGQLPWEGEIPACEVSGIMNGNIPAGTSVKAIEGCIPVLVSNGGLSKEFTISSNQLIITEPFVISSTPTVITGDDSKAAVCYLPNSRSLKTNKNTRFAVDGSVDATCPDDSAGAACYWCVK